MRIVAIHNSRLDTYHHVDELGEHDVPVDVIEIAKNLIPSEYTAGTVICVDSKSKQFGESRFIYDSTKSSIVCSAFSRRISANTKLEIILSEANNG